jgi:hypothetical protein
MVIWIIVALFVVFGIIGFIDLMRPTNVKPHFKQYLTGEIKFIEYRNKEI